MKAIILIEAKARHGKDLFAQEFIKVCEENKEKVFLIHFADAVKMVMRVAFGIEDFKSEEGRSKIQAFATNKIRGERDPYFWGDFVGRLIHDIAPDFDYAIVPDWRFENELEAVINWNKLIPVKTIQLTRLNADGSLFENNLTAAQRLHASETELDGFVNFNTHYFAKNIEEVSSNARNLYLQLNS